MTSLAPLLMAVDGNGMLHRAHHAHAGSDQRDADGRPVWGLRALVATVAGAAARLRPDAVLVGFDCEGEYLRAAEHPLYKAGRPDKPADLTAQLADAPGLLRGAGFAVVQLEGREADDVLASAAELARGQSWRCVVVTSDRDAFALIDETTSVLRVVPGGLDASPLLTPELLHTACGVRPDQYRDYAALRGDPSDNLPGAPGIGAATAARLLAALGTLDDVEAAMADGRRALVADMVGETAARRLTEPAVRDAVQRNRRLMTMHTDLPLPSLGSIRLPLDPTILQLALRARDIRLGPCLWALVGGPPPAPPLWEWADAAVDRPARRSSPSRWHGSKVGAPGRRTGESAAQLALF
ncbi:MAG: 5'-3' exonuclease [Angustibacter sp.]